MQGVFVTGSDTGVGKTHVGVAVTRLLSGRGLRVRVRKPVESGCMPENGVLQPRDALALQAAANFAEPIERICPYRLAKPLSPERAAALEGSPLSLGLLHAACIAGAADDDFLLVEGAGGFYSPVAHGALNADLAAGLGMPVLLVVPDRLGVINHVLLAVEAVRMRGLALAGVVLNQPEFPATTDMDNATDIERWLHIPVLRLPYAPDVELAGQAVLSPLVDRWLA